MSEPVLRRATIPTLLGDLVLTSRDEALSGIWFPAHGIAPERAEQGDEQPGHWLFGLVATQLDEYLDGSRTTFDLPLDPGPRSALEDGVWRLLSEIGFGQTRTYGDLARDLGDPHLAQAVGGACGRNPIAIVVPCHRVLGADGSYTGFAGGERRKAWLLGHEAFVSGRSLFAPELPTDA